MIKNFTYTVEGRNQEICATLGDGGEHARVIFSAAETAETLVILEAEGAIAAIKARFESPEALLDNAIRKVSEQKLIDTALQSGEIQTGQL